MPVLVKFENDWSDEFLCQEFKIFPDMETYNRWLGDLHDLILKGKDEFYFGTNEAHYFENTADLDACLKVYDLLEHEVAVFEKYFGNITSNAFGTGGVLDVDVTDYDDD